MRVFGIDCGTNCTGYGVVDVESVWDDAVTRALTLLGRQDVCAAVNAASAVACSASAASASG